MLFVSTSGPVLLRAQYTPMKGSDPEYGQVAVEKCDLRHAEITPHVWLIEVAAPGDAEEWQTRLNDAVDPEHGRFRVRRATPDEEALVRSGKVTLQR